MYSWEARSKLWTSFSFFMWLPDIREGKRFESTRKRRQAYSSGDRRHAARSRGHAGEWASWWIFLIIILSPLLLFACMPSYWDSDQSRNGKRLRRRQNLWCISQHVLTQSLRAKKCQICPDASTSYFIMGKMWIKGDRDDKTGVYEDEWKMMRLELWCV